MNDDYSPHASRVTRKKGSIYPPVYFVTYMRSSSAGSSGPPTAGVEERSPPKEGTIDGGRGRRFGFGRVVFGCCWKWFEFEV